jgi:chaperonin GroEL
VVEHLRPEPPREGLREIARWDHLRQQRPEIGQLLADALDKTGKDGVVTVEESKTAETWLESVDGLQFDKGTSRPTSSPTRRRWSACSRTPTS